MQALLLMDDPFAGFSHEDVDRLSEAPKGGSIPGNPRQIPRFSGLGIYDNLCTFPPINGSVENG